jgi:hypothetical protein
MLSETSMRAWRLRTRRRQRIIHPKLLSVARRRSNTLKPFWSADLIEFR